MPVELNIVESVTELDTTVVEVILTSASEPGPAGAGVPTGGTSGQILTKDSATDYDTSWQDPAAAVGAAPNDADYLIGTASGSLSAEIVVGTSPGGELGGTWASPTVDTTHSGSSHASVQAAAEATAAAALLAHTTDSSDAHDASAISIADAANDFTATDVEGALAELQSDHETDAQNLADHIADTTDAHAATAIGFTPAGTIAATTVQAAIEEVASEAGGGGGAPTDATYITQTANGTLSNEQALSALSTGIVKVTTTTGVLSTAVADTDYAAATHAARHQNGGADEISIAGLDGTPTELTNHLSDATAAHAASAISADSTTLVGTGTDVQAVLEELDNSIAAAYTPGGTDVALADGGTGASLADPGADRILFWDDSAGAVTWLTAGTNLTITDTTIAASGGGGGSAADDESLILHMAVFA